MIIEEKDKADVMFQHQGANPYKQLEGAPVIMPIYRTSGDPSAEAWMTG